MSGLHEPQDPSSAGRQRLVRWVRPTWYRQIFELWAGDERFVTLRWLHTWHSIAQAETPQGTWRFERRGVWRHQISITDTGTGMPLARVEQRGTGNAQLTLPTTAEVIVWQKTNFWGTRWEWARADGTPLIRYRRRYMALAEAEVVDPSIAPMTEPRTMLLLTVGWYLLWLRIRGSSNG